MYIHEIQHNMHLGWFGTRHYLAAFFFLIEIRNRRRLETTGRVRRRKSLTLTHSPSHRLSRINLLALQNSLCLADRYPAYNTISSAYCIYRKVKVWSSE